jgi:hypothetical protein
LAETREIMRGIRQFLSGANRETQPKGGRVAAGGGFGLQWSTYTVLGGVTQLGVWTRRTQPSLPPPPSREGRAIRGASDTTTPDSWRGEGMRGGGGRRRDERVARSVPPHGGATWGSQWRRVEAGCTHAPVPPYTCTRSRRAPVSPPTRHRRQHPTRAASALPARASSPCPCPTPLLLCLSALPLAVTRHAAVAAKVAVEQRLQRLPPRASLPSTLGLAAVKPRPPHTLSSPRTRCCEKHRGLDLPPRV